MPPWLRICITGLVSALSGLAIVPFCDPRPYSKIKVRDIVAAGLLVGGVLTVIVATLVGAWS